MYERNFSLKILLKLFCLFCCCHLQVQFNIFVKESYSEIGFSRGSMNRVGKTNAAKGVHNNYNAYKDFSLRETEAHICAAFMSMCDMTTMDGMLFLS